MTLTEVSRLEQSRPGLDATDAEVTAWYRRRDAWLRDEAEAETKSGERTHELAFATEADAHASFLVNGGIAA